MAQFKWEGIYPAMLSPFDENGNLDFDMFGKNIEAQLDGGVHGLIIAGSLGEASVLSTEEKYDLLTYALKVVAGRVPVLLNIAENTTAAAIKVAQTSEELGADGLMLLPPMRYRADDREAVAYFSSVSQSTKIPNLI
jgi:4-hydroxy-tetrahydrodipicolinate synthase